MGDIIQSKIRINSSEGVRLVRGSHIVTPRLYDHDKCYFFQGSDGRIIFAISYETDFTLIGTTDMDHADPSTTPECTQEDRFYLIDFANEYFWKANHGLRCRLDLFGGCVHFMMRGQVRPVRPRGIMC